MLLTVTSFVPADTYDLRDAIGIVRVGLVDLEGQRRLGVPCVDADDRQPARLQFVEQPRGELAALQADARDVRCVPLNGGRNVIGRALASSPPDSPAAFVDHADGRLVERDVEADREIAEHDEAPICCGALTLSVARPRDYAMSRPEK